MSDTLLVTGGGGFLGRRFLTALAAAGAPAVVVVSRHPTSLKLPSAAPSGWRVVEGDLERLDSLDRLVAGAATLVHLAARTGRGTAREHGTANRDVTAALAAAARRQGASRFLFVSSIAAGFTDQRHYHYARAKAAAERAVRDSGLAALIVRPTMIFGPASAPLANLRRLALLPRPVVFGPGTRLQPIHVDDVAGALVASLRSPAWPAAPIELGGPDVVTHDELMARIRQAAHAASRPPIHLPLGPLRLALGVLDPIASRFFPITAGQLAAFANPSVAARSPYHDELPAPSWTLDRMLAE